MPLRRLPACKVELHVTGGLASISEQLARSSITFGRGKSEMPESDGRHAASLAKVASLLSEYRGRLKVLLQGHREADERPGVDVERVQAVCRRLVQGAGVCAGLLRAEGRGAGAGRCVMLAPICELVPLYGPISAEAASASAQVGLYFDDRQAEVISETDVIVAEMARWLRHEGVAATVEGHTDKAEPEELALERAHVIRRALVRRGVAPRQLRCAARGCAHPLSAVSAAPNRRAEIHLHCTPEDDPPYSVEMG